MMLLEMDPAWSDLYPSLLTIPWRCFLSLKTIKKLRLSEKYNSSLSVRVLLLTLSGRQLTPHHETGKPAC